MTLIDDYSAEERDEILKAVILPDILMLLNDIASMSSSRWDQRLRYEIGDVGTDYLLEFMRKYYGWEVNS